MTSGRWITASILFLALAAPAAAQPLDRPAFVCDDAQAVEEAIAIARLHDREALEIHARSYCGSPVLPGDRDAWRREREQRWPHVGGDRE